MAHLALFNDADPGGKAFIPNEIDGEPAQVAIQAANELAEASAAYAELVEATLKQIENAGRQAALDAGVEVAEASANLDVWWRENRPAQFAKAEALRAVADRLPAATRALAYAVSRGE